MATRTTRTKPVEDVEDEATKPEGKGIAWLQEHVEGVLAADAERLVTEAVAR